MILEQKYLLKSKFKKEMSNLRSNQDKVADLLCAQVLRRCLKIFKNFPKIYNKLIQLIM